MAKIGVSPYHASTAWALPLLGQVLPNALPGIKLYTLVLHQQQEIGIALPSVDLVGMLLAKGDKGRRADLRSAWGSVPISSLLD
jgi:hypothetical protein